MVESKKVFKRTNWVCWDVEWQRITLCDGQFEYFDQKNQGKLTIQGFCPKKYNFWDNYFTCKHLKQLYGRTITCATTLFPQKER